LTRGAAVFRFSLRQGGQTGDKVNQLSAALLRQDAACRQFRLIRQSEQFNGASAEMRKDCERPDLSSKRPICLQQQALSLFF